jgi:carbonic anhydrase
MSQTEQHPPQPHATHHPHAPPPRTGRCTAPQRDLAASVARALTDVTIAVFLALRRLTRTRIAVAEEEGRQRVRGNGQLTLLGGRVTPSDLFAVRNVGNLTPPPGADAACDSVAAAVEYAADALRVNSLTVCGHSGCGAMKALLASAGQTAPAPGEPLDPTAPDRWLRHGAPGLARMAGAPGRAADDTALTGRPVADAHERLALVNICRRLDRLRAYPCMARRVADGSLTLHGIHSPVGEAQAYVLDGVGGRFSAVRAEAAPIPA